MSERKPLSEIAVGDRVWLSSGHGDDRRSIGTVARLTATLVILECPPHLVRYNRYRRSSEPAWEGGQHRFYEVAASSFAKAITDIATAGECAKWDAEQARVALASAERQALRDQIDAKRQELSALFTNSGYVSHETNNTAGQWHVNLWFADESEVRRLAELIPQLELAAK